jgi:hypothetical protein
MSKITRSANDTYNSKENDACYDCSEDEEHYDSELVANKRKKTDCQPQSAGYKIKTPLVFSKSTLNDTSTQIDVKNNFITTETEIPGTDKAEIKKLFRQFIAVQKPHLLEFKYELLSVDAKNDNKITSVPEKNIQL